MKKSVMGLLFAVGLMGSLAALPAQAQQDNGGGGGNGGGQGGGGGGGGGGRPGRGGGNFNFQQFQQQRMERIKDAMGVSDDDWKAIEPKIQNVQQLQFQTQTRGMRPGRGGPGGGGGGPGGGGGGGGGQATDNAPANPVAQAMRDLQTTLDNKDATPEQIKSKVEALRTAKKGAADSLKKAQDDLRELLTVRQEAVLVEQGMLD